MLNLPMAFSESPGEICAGAPELGQHTEQVLVEELGYSWDEITALREGDVI
jgi:crotonobetainyl-CoA:carnitine CoA-transferase CaiB-like acyl-CoA transferase